MGTSLEDGAAMTATYVEFLDDAAWDTEREAVVVTGVLRVDGRPRHVRCVIAREALEALVRAPAELPPLRVFRDFEATLAKTAAQRARADADEVVLGRRDIRR